MVNCNVDDIDKYITIIKSSIGDENQLVVREILIGKKQCLRVAIIYINGLANKDIIDRDIMHPLMFQIEEEFIDSINIDYYLCSKYIAVSNTFVEININKVVENIKRGKTVILIDGSCKFVVVDTTGGVYRAISEPISDESLRGPREGFVENLEINISMLRRKIKDKNLKTEKYTLGRRSQTDLVIMYIDDIVDKEFLEKIKKQVSIIDIDSVPSNSTIEQCIEEHSYSVFPQFIGSERPDVVEANLMEGRIVFLLEGTPYVSIYPSTFFDFFQTNEDYYGRVIQAWFIRIIRIIATFTVLSFPAIYITFIKFNPELIPIDYIESLIEDRMGTILTPFMGLIAINLTIEFIRESGFRLPSKIGGTLNIVGGIIIGDAALKSKAVSATTLLVAGLITVAAFVISNYQMSMAIRILNYPMIILANWLGTLGIVLGWFFILAYLCSMENYGVPYFAFHMSDMKDIFTRAPIWKMNKRPDIIPNNNPIRQSDFRGGKDE